MHATADFAPTSATTPLQGSGSLDKFKSFEVTPCIGTEFEDVDLAEWITGTDSETLLKDLAVLICQRGVVFFRGQTKVDGELQKTLTRQLGWLSGKPKDHNLAKHILHEIRKDDPEMGKLDAATQQALHKGNKSLTRQTHAYEWHSDGSYETCPPDFTCLRMTEVPETGGDTLWASGYELYDRLSPPYQQFFESLTATHDVPGLRNAAETMDVYKGERGAPENIGLEFRKTQPVVRTHPVTGWKTLFAGGLHCRVIDGVSEAESQDILTKILRLVSDNHDLQVRFRWNGSGDMAIWDNRCTLHCPTQDHYGQGIRKGWRTVGIAEKPYLDTESLSRLQSKLAKLEESSEVQSNGVKDEEASQIKSKLVPVDETPTNNGHAEKTV